MLKSVVSFLPILTFFAAIFFMLIGLQRSLYSVIRPLKLPTGRDEAGGGSRTIMQIAVSILLLGAALFVILSQRYDDSSKHWAFATVGTIIGYWLKA
jgi:hypothetical protein